MKKLQDVWTCGESERNHWQTSSCKVKLRGKMTNNANKTVVGRCKGMDRAELECDAEGIPFRLAVFR